MESIRKLTLAIGLALLVFGCSVLTGPSPQQGETVPAADAVQNEEAGEDAAPPETPADVQSQDAAQAPAITYSDYPGGQAIDLAVTPSGTLYVAYGQGDGIFVTRSTDGGATYSPPVQANPGIPAYSMSIARPSIIAEDSGKVIVAWKQLLEGNTGNIWYAVSSDGGGTFQQGALLGPSKQFRAFLVSLAFDTGSNPLASWLLDGRLIFTKSTDSGTSFGEPRVIDEEVCDCCQPEPLVANGLVHIAYRNLEHDGEGRAIRDIYLMTSSDGGQNFGAPVRVSDAPWYLDACPNSGPSAASYGNNLYVAWMDGRFDVEGNFSRTDIWFSASADLGLTFSPNLRINPTEGQFNGLPTLGVGPDGRIHIAWEQEAGGERELFYSYSNDGGKTFVGPITIAVSNEGNGRGRLYNSALVVGPDGRVYLAWMDRLGVHIASW